MRAASGTRSRTDGNLTSSERRRLRRPPDRALTAREQEDCHEVHAADARHAGGLGWTRALRVAINGIQHSRAVGRSILLGIAAREAGLAGGGIYTLAARCLSLALAPPGARR